LLTLFFTQRLIFNVQIEEEKMKKFLLVLSVFLMVFSVTGIAGAVSFTDTIDYWNLDGSNYGEFLTEDHLFDSVYLSDSQSFSYVHSTGYDLSLYDISDLTLTLDFTNMDGLLNLEGDDVGSNWLLGSWDYTESVQYGYDGLNWTEIGEIDTEANSDSVDDVYTTIVNVTFLDSNGDLTIYIDVFNSLGTADIWLDSSTLSGNAELVSVPEPSTMLLLGAGLLSIAGFGRKKFRK
jgi:hypothetical protein